MTKLCYIYIFLMNREQQLNIIRTLNCFLELIFSLPEHQTSIIGNLHGAALSLYSIFVNHDLFHVDLTSCQLHFPQLFLLFLSE